RYIGDNIADRRTSNPFCEAAACSTRSSSQRPGPEPTSATDHQTVAADKESEPCATAPHTEPQAPWRAPAFSASATAPAAWLSRRRRIAQPFEARVSQDPIVVVFPSIEHRALSPVLPILDLGRRVPT